MAIFTISDLHLSFENEEKSMEVFAGWGNYTARLKENWGKTVKNEDTVIIIGDISWAMKLEDSFKDFEFINNLPGKKVLIKGNHDYWWSTTAKVNNFLKQSGFESISILYNSALEVENIGVCGTRGWLYRCETDQDRKILNREVGRLERSLDEAKKENLEPVVFLHYPPVYGNEESEEIINLLIEKKVKKCYYGHIHDGGATKRLVEGNYKGIDFRLVSCDYINFCPVLVR